MNRVYVRAMATVRRARIGIAVGLVVLVALVLLRNGCPDDRVEPSVAAPVVRTASTPRVEPRPEVVALDGGLGSSLEAMASSDAGRTLDRAAVARLLVANADIARREVDAFCRLQTKLASFEPFSRKTGARDAAVFMNGRVDWSVDDEVVRVGLLHVPENVAADLRGDGWLKRAAPSSDLSWWSTLRTFDVWSAVADGPMRDSAIANGVSASPVIDCGSLLLQSRIRFVRAAESNDWAHASADVRHLAFLLHSMGLAIGDACAVTVLRGAEGQAAAQVVASGGRTDGWAVPNQSNLLAFRELAVTSASFAGPGVEPDVRAKALACAELTQSRCRMVTEATSAFAAFRELTDERLPPEAAAGCDAETVRRAENGPTLTQDGLDALSHVTSFLPPDP